MTETQDTTLADNMTIDQVRDGQGGLALFAHEVDGAWLKTDCAIDLEERA